VKLPFYRNLSDKGIEKDDGEDFPERYGLRFVWEVERTCPRGHKVVAMSLRILETSQRPSQNFENGGCWRGAIHDGNLSGILGL
jgi:hypothetical protein